jgi:hypothetical protein
MVHRAWTWLIPDGSYSEGLPSCYVLGAGNGSTSLVSVAWLAPQASTDTCCGHVGQHVYAARQPAAHKPGGALLTSGCCNLNCHSMHPYCACSRVATQMQPPQPQ